MKKILSALIITIIIFVFNVWVVVPIISNMGYSSVESSYHLVTHSLLLSLIFLLILSTLLILEKIEN
ncbi:MAG: hypothetical protein U0N84_00700 [Terrisporobacter sp.]|uniref:hypothetical protein n=1 Tax=Terrisporobacter sp. TaxID=1965305 RepID=UPI002F9557B7